MSQSVQSVTLHEDVETFSLNHLANITSIEWKIAVTFFVGHWQTCTVRNANFVNYSNSSFHITILTNVDLVIDLDFNL